MDTLKIDATERTPKIVFDFDNNHFLISGESYPENISEFYRDIINQLDTHVSDLQDAQVVLDFDLIYFNSSTAKVIMKFCEIMEKISENLNTVVVNWYYEEDDDNMRKLGEEFSKDVGKAQFNLIEKE